MSPARRVAPWALLIVAAACGLGSDGPVTTSQAVDTTAAGDVFNGVLAAGLASGLRWKDSLERANRAAALSVTRMGAQASAPYLKELQP